MVIDCEGCGIELENWNNINRTWDEVQTGKVHACPQKEKLREALKAKRNSMKSTDKNVEQYAIQMIYCNKCGARYSNVLKKCPQCKRNFVKKLFKEPMRR